MAQRKTSTAKASEAAAAPQANEAAPSSKRSPILLVGASALLFLGAGAGAFLLLPSPAPAEAEMSGVHGKMRQDAATSADHAGKHGAKKDQIDAGGPAAGPVLGQFTLADETAFYLPDPFVVSLGQDAAVKHLKITLAIEAPPEAGYLYAAKALRLRAAMTTYLRAVDMAVLRDPAAMSSLREQLKRRAEFVVSPQNVRDVLILDFILT